MKGLSELLESLKAPEQKRQLVYLSLEFYKEYLPDESEEEEEDEEPESGLDQPSYEHQPSYEDHTSVVRHEDKHREIINLRKQGNSMGKIAEALTIPKSTVQSDLERHDAGRCECFGAPCTQMYRMYT